LLLVIWQKLAHINSHMTVQFDLKTFCVNWLLTIVMNAYFHISNF